MTEQYSVNQKKPETLPTGIKEREGSLDVISTLIFIEVCPKNILMSFSVKICIIDIIFFMNIFVNS